MVHVDIVTTDEDMYIYIGDNKCIYAEYDKYLSTTIEAIVRVFDAEATFSYYMWNKDILDEDGELNEDPPEVMTDEFKTQLTKYGE